MNTVTEKIRIFTTVSLAPLRSSMVGSAATEDRKSSGQNRAVLYAMTRRTEPKMNHKTVRLILLVIATAVMAGGLVRSAHAASVAYSATVQGRGWQPVVADGEMVGTTGESLPIEHFRIFVGGMPGVSVRYSAWLPSTGRITDPVADGQIIGGAAPGTPNAVSIWLEGAPADTGICYEVHVAEHGWQQEVCNGAWAYGPQSPPQRALIIVDPSNPAYTGSPIDWESFFNVIQTFEIQALRIRLYGQPDTAVMSIPPTGMPYDSTKAAEEQALRDNPPPWDSSDAYSGDNSQSPVETVRQPLTAMDDTGTITLFHHEEEDTWGGNRWAAGYQLKAYAKTQRDNWTANSSTHGYVNAWGKILSNSFPAFTATTVANTINNPNSKWAGIWYSIYIFGNKVKEETVGGGVYNATKNIYEVKNRRVTPEWKQTFWVGPVPVTVGAYGSMNAFIALKGKFWIDELDGTIEPSGSLWATTYAKAGIDGVVAGGVKGQLSLLEAAVPMNAKITWMFGVNDGGQCEAAVTGSAKASAILKELSGRLAVCGEVFPFGERCKGIGGYDGFRQTINLFDVSTTKGLAFGRCADGVTLPPTQT